MFLTHGKAGSQWMTSVLSDPRVLAYVPNVRFRRQVGQHDWPTYLSETEDSLFAPIYGVNHFEWTAGLLVAVALMWLVPDRRFEPVIAGREEQRVK
jgi:hypothetical protein